MMPAGPEERGPPNPNRTAVAEVWMARVLVAPALPGVTTAGVKVAVAPVGSPVVVRVTGRLKLPEVDCHVDLVGGDGAAGDCLGRSGRGGW